MVNEPTTMSRSVASQAKYQSLYIYIQMNTNDVHIYNEKQTQKIKDGMINEVQGKQVDVLIIHTHTYMRTCLHVFQI